MSVARSSTQLDPELVSRARREFGEAEERLRELRYEEARLNEEILSSKSTLSSVYHDLMGSGRQRIRLGDVFRLSRPIHVRK